ncbi:hypothetical protein [Methanolobus halotolerans]|uniref:Uncharacterized protein n=1 Tax=Methanolobus halotolerans TaxID=2052935 RepID=A0A4E0Q3C2_9EURY|nr:hypothetical protein [Methanolobus halotolerans]TGC07904.1 hypothetical protein CUN85_10695 [Methanolobus halotolerans]
MNTKYVAIFLAVIMLMSIGTFFFSGPLSNNDQDDNGAGDPADAPGFETIPGTRMQHELDSVLDGLEMTPQGVSVASYVDYSRVYNTPLQIMAPNITEIYSIYNTMIMQRYSAYSATGDFAFEAHTISPEVINFEYMLTEDSYNGYYMLSRGGELYNVVGTPMLLGSRNDLENVIDVKSGTANSSTDFERILSYVEPGAEYSTLVIGDGPVEQYYLEYRDMNDGNYSRTEVFVEPDQSLLDNISAMEANSTDRNLYYNTTTYGDENVTKVVITTNASNIYGLILEQFR